MTATTAENLNIDGNLSVAPPRSPTRVMAILEVLARDSHGLPLARLCERLDQPKSTLLSLLRALEEEQYVVNHQGLYQLGEAALRLGAMICASFPFPASVHKQLVSLCERMNESVLMAVLSSDGTQAVYVDKVEPGMSLRYTVDIGTRRPLFCTAVGRALLAFQEPEFIERYLRDQPLINPRQKTKTDPRTLRSALTKVRERGFSSAFDEHTEGVGAYAAAVFDSTGLVRAAVSIAGPMDRMRSRAADFETAIRETAAAVSRVLGFRGADDTRPNDQFALPRRKK